MTYGHPRSLVAAFKKYDTYEKLMTEYTTPDIPGDSVNWQDFAVRVRYYENPLKEMMDSAAELTLFDIRSEWRDKGENPITFDLIANMFGFAWDGTIDNATLHIAPYVQQAILASVYPFKAIMDDVVPSVGRIAIEDAEMFELLCVTRFQELFNEEAHPFSMLPDFFTKDQHFGSTVVHFAKSTSWLPKVSRPQEWWALVNEIDGLVSNQDSLCLKPLPQPPSSDILLMSLLQDSTKLTVGLAIKKCAPGKTKVSEETIKEECDKFNGMFSSKEGRLNVLIVCATAYTDTVMNYRSEVEKQQGCLSACYRATGYEQIHEVILLFLTTPENRAKFFGIEDNDEHKEALERIIENLQLDSTSSAATAATVATE